MHCRVSWFPIKAYCKIYTWEWWTFWLFVKPRTGSRIDAKSKSSSSSSTPLAVLVFKASELSVGYSEGNRSRCLVVMLTLDSFLHNCPQTSFWRKQYLNLVKETGRMLGRLSGGVVRKTLAFMPNFSPFPQARDISALRKFGVCWISVAKNFSSQIIWQTSIHSANLLIFSLL